MVRLNHSKLPRSRRAIRVTTDACSRDVSDPLGASPGMGTGVAHVPVAPLSTVCNRATGGKERRPSCPTTEQRSGTMCSQRNIF